MRWTLRMVAVVALVALSACGTTTPPAPGGAASGSASATAAAGGSKSTAETCTAIKAVRMDLLSVLLDASTVESSDPETQRREAADKVNAAVTKAMADLKKAGDETSDAKLKAATADFVTGLTAVTASLKAAGTDIDKISEAVDNDQANAAERTILGICLDA